ncbi:MAG TPA: CoA-binding protein [Dehalococcoidia bacterium]|nr:CoA-binding protein [Dehalococcoidia bacterium]
MKQGKLGEFEAVFYPKSIAVVGVPRNKETNATLYLRGLLNWGFKGKLYPVNPNLDSFLGLKAYPDLKSIPEPVDYVYVSIPRNHVLALLDDCVTKKVKVVQFFTAGFSEMGDEEGIRLEEEIVRKAREGGFRVIGPNCVGVYSPKVNMTPPGGPLGEVGSTAFISQSGSIILRVVQNGITCGLRFSKAVSFGNGCDLDSTDFLEYFAIDPETKVIGAYLEGVKDGGRFLQTIKEISKRKPLIIWKGGETQAGAKAATSHTASLTSSALLWEVALKQAGVVQVHNLEELVDTLFAFQQLPLLKDYGITIISGLADGGGGQSVAAADICSKLGLEVPPFGNKTKEQLSALIGRVGAILHNPLDVSQAGGNPETIGKAIEIAANDRGISLIIVQESIDLMLSIRSWEWIERISDVFIDFRKKHKKPIVIVLESGLAEAERRKIVEKLLAAQIPVFPTMQRAAKAIANMRRYFDYLRGSFLRTKCKDRGY